MKKITNFAVISIITCPLIILFMFFTSNIRFELFQKEITTSIVLIIYICVYCLSLKWIIIYEIITYKKFVVGKIKESKIYKILLLFRVLCILAIIACILNIICVFFYTYIDSILVIASVLWAILSIYSSPFEENLSTTNSLLISDTVILIIVIAYFCEYAINILFIK